MNCHPEEDILRALRVGMEIDNNPQGVRFHLTHALNVQRFHHRDCGLANFAFLSGSVAELIGILELGNV